MDLLWCLLGVCDAMAQVADSAGELTTAGAEATADATSADAVQATDAADANGVETGTEETATDGGAEDGDAEGEGDGSSEHELNLFLTWFGIIVVVLAQAAAPWVLARYRKRLTGFMQTASRETLGLAAADDATRWDADTLLSAIERQRRAVLRVLVGVVLLYSLAAAVIYGWQFDDRLDHAVSLSVSFMMFAAFSGPVVLLGVSASNFARWFWIYFAPAAFAAAAMQTIIAATGDEAERTAVLWALGGVLLLTLVSVAVREWAPPALWPWLRARRWRVALAALFGFLVLLGALAPEDVDVRSEAFEVFLKLVLGCVIAMVAIMLCYFTLVDRTKRIVVPLIAAALMAATVAFVVFVAVAFATLEPGTGGAVVLLLLLGLVPGWLTASFLLSWIGLAYAQKLFSDAQFQVFCWMIAVAGVVVCVETLTNDEPLWGPINIRLLGATAVALLAYWALTRYGIKPLPTNKRLLVLRVFAQDQRGERLLDELEYRWRFIGPIVLIGANDVAGRTIDPAKAADYLRGKLKNTFVPDSHALHKRVAAIDEAPDPDGRYRVNEFFCFDDTWKEAVQLLLDSSDAIVLDLSGFTAERRGTAYELGLLKERGALARTVFLVSAMTDLDAVRAALHLAPGAALPVGSVLEVDQRLDGDAVVAALVHGMVDAGRSSPALGAPGALAAAPR